MPKMSTDYGKVLKDKFDNNPSNVIKKWNVYGTNKLEDKIKNAKQDQWEDIINRIVLWKVDRQVEIDDELIDRIVNHTKRYKWTEKENYDELRKLLFDMLSCRGVRIPMASTILHFLHPNTFCIIDRRAYRVVYEGKEYKESNSNSEKNKYKKADDYIEYMKKCKEYYEKNKLADYGIKFKDLDRYTYQLDIEAGNKVNEG